MRRLVMVTVAALALALLLASATAANAQQGPLAGTVQQAVGSVAGATSAVAQTAATATQPVTHAVAQTTTPVTGAVQETVSRVTHDAQPDAQPVVDEVADTTAAVVSGATGQARESTPAHTSSSGAQRPAAHSPAPPAGVQISQAGRRHRGDSFGSRAGEPQAQSAGAGDRGESRGRLSTEGPVAPAARAQFATPVAADSCDDAAKRVNGVGSGLPGPEMPAGASGSASGVSSGLGLSGLALLALTLCLTVPWLLQRLPGVPAGGRPLLLVSLLERPG
jgi:gas vesicle protein